MTSLEKIAEMRRTLKCDGRTAPAWCGLLEAVAQEIDRQVELIEVESVFVPGRLGMLASVLRGEGGEGMSKVDEYVERCREASRIDTDARNSCPKPCYRVSNGTELARVNDFNRFVELRNLETIRQPNVLRPEDALVLAAWIIENYGEKG